MACDGLELYWQPGCTSCLRAKEFLATHGIAYRSINVLAEPAATAALAALGARSVPVLRRGEGFIFAQDLDELARFVGVDPDRPRLGVEALAGRLQALLAIATNLCRALPSTDLEERIPTRPRSYSELIFHIGMIAHGFLAAARGGNLEYSWYERIPAAHERTPAALASGLEATRDAVASWWLECAAVLPAAVQTYYGRHPLAQVLERTTWHVAQHCRQLDFIVAHLGGSPTRRLTEADLEGLPVPAGVWDAEIGAQYQRH